MKLFMKYTTFLVTIGFVAITVFSLVAERSSYAALFMLQTPERVIANQKMTLGVAFGQDAITSSDAEDIQEKTFTINIDWGDVSLPTKNFVLVGLKNSFYFDHVYTRATENTRPFAITVLVTNEQGAKFTQTVDVPVYAAESVLGISIFEGPKSLALKQGGVWNYVVGGSDPLPYYRVEWGDGATELSKERAPRSGGTITHEYEKTGKYKIKFELVNTDKTVSAQPKESEVTVFEQVPQISSMKTTISGNQVRLQINAFFGTDKKGLLRITADWKDGTKRDVREVRNGSVFSLVHKYKKSSPEYRVDVRIEDPKTGAFIEYPFKSKKVPATRASLLESIFVFPFYSLWQ